MSDAQDAGDVDDEQATAEELDDDRFGDEVGDDDGVPPDYPPDHALASLEATAPIDTGDVPQDSLRERLWREEPDTLPARDEPVDLVEPHPDAGLDPDFAAESEGEFVPGGLQDGVDAGELVGLAADAGALAPAEEAAVHVIDEPD